MAHPSLAFLSILFITEMIQVHVKFFLDELEDLQLKDIIKYAIDINHIIFLKGVPCISTASKLVENLFGIESECTYSLWYVYIWTKFSCNTIRSLTYMLEVLWLLSPYNAKISMIAKDQLEIFLKFIFCNIGVHIQTITCKMSKVIFAEVCPV